MVSGSADYQLKIWDFA
jgi:WD40 repeat protein